MATCANCSSDALYVYQIASNYGINYCQRHLPSFLSRGPQPNLFEAPVEEVVDTKPKSKKSEAVAEPDVVVEDDASNS